MRPWLPNSAVRDKKVSSLPAECVLLLTVVVTHKFNNFSRVIVRITPRSRGDLAKVNKQRRSALKPVNSYFLFFFFYFFTTDSFPIFPPVHYIFKLKLFFNFFFLFTKNFFTILFWFPQFLRSASTT